MDAKTFTAFIKALPFINHDTRLPISGANATIERASTTKRYHHPRLRDDARRQHEFNRKARANQLQGMKYIRTHHN